MRWLKYLVFILTDSSDSVSRELVEAGLVDGKDMIVGWYHNFYHS